MNTSKMTNTDLISLGQAIQMYQDSVALARSSNTARTYRYAMHSFSELLVDHKINIDQTHPSELTEDAMAWFATKLKEYTPATEQLYLTAVKGFYEYLVAENLVELNLARVKLLMRQRGRRPGQRLPQFPRKDIENILNYAISLANSPADSPVDALRNLRDRAFLLTLADTGLRVHEACGLRRGDLDWDESRAIVIGKGNRQAVVRFSRRCILALRDYLTARSTLDGASGRSLSSLPLFARHDKGAGKKIKAITTTTGRNIVAQRVREALGEPSVGMITPHSFRHYFVTTVLRASGGNLKLAQELARHKNIAVTQLYAHLSDDDLDQGYWEIFESQK